MHKRNLIVLNLTLIIWCLFKTTFLNIKFLQYCVLNIVINFKKKFSFVPVIHLFMHIFGRRRSILWYLILSWRGDIIFHFNCGLLNNEPFSFVYYPLLLLENSLFHINIYSLYLHLFLEYLLEIHINGSSYLYCFITMFNPDTSWWSVFFIIS